jgi:uncharacterized protein (DUF697 family)/predicted GTPase
MFERIRRFFSGDEFRAELEQLRERTPIPVFWLFGKTQSGKTSIIKYLTGADDAEIGQGFRPCTRFSRLYQFPTAEAPLLTFLDTRGLDEPGYDPEEDLAKFNDQTHVVIVTVKALDHAQAHVVEHLRRLRKARPSRPVLLTLTCLHEAYPQEQHPLPYPFTDSPARAAPDLLRSIAQQEERFAGLFDEVVPIDLTPPAEGFNDPDYGGPELKQTLLKVLPVAYRQSLLHLDQATHELADVYARRALPYIYGYAGLAATAGAMPIPWLDLLVLPGIQTRMVTHLAQLYGQPLSATRFLEAAGTLGLGALARQAVREVVKFIPFVGSVAGAALAGAATYALGKAFCYYYTAVHHGHVPKAEDLKRYYEEQLKLARQHWRAEEKSAATGGSEDA